MGKSFDSPWQCVQSLNDCWSTLWIWKFKQFVLLILRFLAKNALNIALPTFKVKMSVPHTSWREKFVHCLLGENVLYSPSCSLCNHSGALRMWVFKARWRCGYKYGRSPDRRGIFPCAITMTSAASILTNFDLVWVGSEIIISCLSLYRLPTGWIKEGSQIENRHQTEDLLTFKYFSFFTCG